MLKAIKQGDLEEVRKMLEVNNNIDKTEIVTLSEEILDSDLDRATVAASLLQCAVLYNKFNIVEFLIISGANIHSLDKYNMNALFYAIRSDADLKIIELLIEHGIDINHKNKYGKSALHIAVSQKILQIVDLLLKKSADVNCTVEESNLTPLHIAALRGSLKMIEALVYYGANVNVQCSNGQSPLHKLTYFSDEFRIEEDFLEEEEIVEHWKNMDQIVHFLLDHGANINFRDLRSVTPLHLSVSLNDLKTTSIFLKYGALVDTLDYDNCSPLTTATENQNFDIINLLLDHNANMNFQVSYKSAIHHAVILGNLHILYKLLQRKPDVNNLLLNRETPLMYVVRTNIDLKHQMLNEFTCDYLSRDLYHRNIKIMDLLLKYGADVNLCTNGYSPLNFAIIHNDEIMLKLLLKYSPNINVQSIEGTSLILAAKYNRTDLIALLLEYGADVNVNFSKDVCLLQYAINNGNGVLVDMLLLHIIHLKASENHISQDNWNIFNYQMTIRGSCFETELEKLKNNFIPLNPKLSLYDVYSKKKCLRQISMCSRDKDVRSNLKNNMDMLYLGTFPNYSMVMKNNIETLINEAEMFDQSFELMNFVLGKTVFLPEEITTHIINFFSYEEKKDFIYKCKEYFKDNFEN